ncbi:hypothetical protein N792_07105 [Lysobacter concretionis Ko07 = DSM 16239]|uniref:Uncharacterized protein n=1 Tax=Lysobacter concretionis Ko07 = DSM 16239 TaxID=1122185 RepID=A0A0A0EPM0_9GAMM|nr:MULTISPECIES: hypothetical protein [Lysobacter]KGM52098.1 hypothetical protein N792_07105 [Lysobacter concretionis Ko07 = DSM 16239]
MDGEFDAARYREHVPPTWAGLCAGRRGFAGHGNPYGDHLLVWWQTGGQERAPEVRRYLARCASLAWHCEPLVAVAAITDAMALVASRRCRPAGVAAKALRMRNGEFLRLRTDAARWLSRGIDQAVGRYRSGTLRPRF